MYQRSRLRGPVVAHSSIVPRKSRPASVSKNANLIANAPAIEIPAETNIPNEYEFEIIRLRRRVEELECIVRDRDRRVVVAIATLESELRMWRTLVHDHVTETHDGVMRRIFKIESTLETLKAIESFFYPPMEIPAGRKKTER